MDVGIELPSVMDGRSPPGPPGLPRGSPGPGAPEPRLPVTSRLGSRAAVGAAAVQPAQMPQARGCPQAHIARRCSRVLVPRAVPRQPRRPAGSVTVSGGDRPGRTRAYPPLWSSIWWPVRHPVPARTGRYASVRWMVNAEPSPGVLAASMCPPCWPAIQRAMARPRPVPLAVLALRPR